VRILLYYHNNCIWYIRVWAHCSVTIRCPALIKWKAIGYKLEAYYNNTLTMFTISWYVKYFTTICVSDRTLKYYRRRSITYLPICALVCCNNTEISSVIILILLLLLLWPHASTKNNNINNNNNIRKRLIFQRWFHARVCMCGESLVSVAGKLLLGDRHGKRCSVVHTPTVSLILLYNCLFIIIFLFFLLYSRHPGRP